MCVPWHTYGDQTASTALLVFDLSVVWDMRPPVLPYLICLVDPSLEEGASRWEGEGEAQSVQVKAREAAQRMKGTGSAVAASGSHRWKTEAGEEGRAGWAVAEEVVPVTRTQAVGWKAPEVCCSVREEVGQLLCGWGACCPREEVVEGACHPRLGLGWGAEGAWRTERKSSRGSGVQSRLQKHLGFRERGAWGLPALSGIPGCADLTEWVLAYLVPEGEGYRVWSPSQASGEAFGSWAALGDHSCVLVRVWGTAPGRLGAKRAWQMWLFLLVAKLVVGFPQNLKDKKTHTRSKSEEP